MGVLAECSELHYVLQVPKVFQRCRSKQFQTLSEASEGFRVYDEEKRRNNGGAFRQMTTNHCRIG